MVQIEPGLGLLMYRHGAGEDARALVGADVLGVQGVAEEHLPGEHPGRPFGDDPTDAAGTSAGSQVGWNPGHPSWKASPAPANTPATASG